MPTHAVVAMAIEIQEASVELAAAGLIHLFQQGNEPLRPTGADVLGTAVAVAQALLPQESCQAWSGSPSRGSGPMARHRSQTEGSVWGPA